MSTIDLGVVPFSSFVPGPLTDSVYYPMWRPVLFNLVLQLVLGLILVGMTRGFLREWWDRTWVRRTVVAMPIVATVCVAGWAVTMVLTGSRGGIFASIAALIALIEFALILALPLSGVLWKVARWGRKRKAKSAPSESTLGGRADEESPLGDTHSAEADDEEIAARLRNRRALPARHHQHASERSRLVTVPEIEVPAFTTPQPVGPTRRAFMAGAIAVPVTTSSASIGGVVLSQQTARVYKRPLKFANLPRALEGFKILHLSDIHIGHAVGLADLEAVLTDAEAHSPNLVLVTGDLSDDLFKLPDALSLIAQLNTSHGQLASIGNHEYFRGLHSVLRAHDKSEVPMLYESSHRLPVGDNHIHLAGADDPVRLRGDPSGFLENTVAAVVDGRNEEDFTILLSHRPRGFDAAARRGVELTLSGHTHGGQIGLLGRSVFETVASERYMWGHYEKDNGSQLYTSSGVGHWLPFRLGCPTEAPVIVLESA